MPQESYDTIHAKLGKWKKTPVADLFFFCLNKKAADLRNDSWQSTRNWSNKHPRRSFKYSNEIPSPTTSPNPPESNIDETSQTFTSIAMSFCTQIHHFQLFQAVLAASTALLEKTGGLSTPASGYQAIWVELREDGGFFSGSLNLHDKNPQHWFDLTRKPKARVNFIFEMTISWYCDNAH